MAGSFNPKPSFHLCPDFSIAPSPDGHLQLGSILQNLDLDGVLAPLDAGETAPVPDSQIFPKNKSASEKKGFSRTLKDLRQVKGGVWARVFGWESLGPSFSILRSRENDETLTVEKLFVRYFNPTPEYKKNALETDGVAFYVRQTKFKKPVWMVIGLMWTEGAKLSKVKAKKTRVEGRVTGTDPNTGITVGGELSYDDEGSLLSSFDGSTPFILGIRVRKIWWDEQGTRHDELDVVGATLGDPSRKKDVTHGLRYADSDETLGYETVVDEETSGEGESVTWVFPTSV